MKIIWAGKLKCLVDNEDFEYLSNFKWHDRGGYARKQVSGMRIQMHRPYKQ